MVVVSIDIQGGEKLRGKIRSLATLGFIRAAIRDMTLFAEKEAKSNAPRDTGALARDIRAEVKPLSGRVHMPRNLEYFRVQEEGRKPGAKMPPPSELRGWARRHGFDTSPGALFILARAIARRGIKGRFYMRKAAQSTERALPSRLRKTAHQVEREWRA